MSYTVLAALAVLAAVLVDLVVLRTRLLGRRIFWVAYAVVLGFQLAVNGVLTGRGVVRYDPGTIIGWRIAYAPVEDLAFGFALVTFTLVGWVRLGRPPARRPACRGRRDAGVGDAGQRSAPSTAHGEAAEAEE